MYSYHIFYFPFKWDVLSKDVSSSFSERIDLDSICFNEYSPWERVFDNQKETDYLLYNEKNYFYSFVHPVLYDTGKKGTVMQHFERKEVRRGNVRYNIQIKGKETYSLVVEDMVINLYSTGVGILVFYLRNDLYSGFDDILWINQFGRRIFPPFLGRGNSLSDAKASELAESISISGLNGSSSRYYEDFHWYDSPTKAWDPAKFIQFLVLDLSEDFVMIPYEGKRDLTSLEPEKLRKGVVPAIDDRMFVSCIVLDDELTKEIENGKFQNDERWLKYLLVDTSYCCVQNDRLREKVLDEKSYLRWQKLGTLFGYSRYSFVGITTEGDFGKNVLQPYFKTMYSRMMELALVQRASVLKFSGEVTRLSNLKKQDPHLISRISDLYREYIRFVNQIYFREVTAQEQGIELYQALQIQIGLREQVESLDAEIEELHQYATLIEDRDQNKQLNLITKIGGMFLIPSLLVGYFGMNIFSFNTEQDGKMLTAWFITGMLITLLAFVYIFFICKRPLGKIIAWIILVLSVIGVFSLTYYIKLI